MNKKLKHIQKQLRREREILKGFTGAYTDGITKGLIIAEEMIENFIVVDRKYHKEYLQ